VTAQVQLYRERFTPYVDADLPSDLPLPRFKDMVRLDDRAQRRGALLRASAELEREIGRLLHRVRMTLELAGSAYRHIREYQLKQAFGLIEASIEDPSPAIVMRVDRFRRLLDATAGGTARVPAAEPSEAVETMDPAEVEARRRREDATLAEFGFRIERG
jgi:hypothetical protein